MSVCVCVCVCATKFFFINITCDLKAVQMNGKYRLIWKLMVYKFELNHTTMGAAKTFVVRKLKEQLITKQ